MKKLLLFAAAVAVAGFLGWLPAEQKDVGGLLPAQTLVLTLQDGQLDLDGGQDLKGTGWTWETAMEDLEATAPGRAFFGATEHIVLVGDAAGILQDVLQDQNLRPAARIYAGKGTVEADSATEFLNAHKAGVTIQSLRSAILEGRDLNLPLLTGEDGRYHLDQ